jgi:hypothetical protein
MEVVSVIGTALVKRAVSGVAEKYGAALGEPFRSELQAVRAKVDEIKSLLESERVALLHDGFDFIMQGDLDAARISLTRAKNREPQSPVVRFWLGAVLACQGRDGAAQEFTRAVELNPLVVPPGLGWIFDFEHVRAAIDGLSGWKTIRRRRHVIFASLGAIDPIVVYETTGNEQIYSWAVCHDINTGEEKWRSWLEYPLRGFGLDPLVDISFATPTVLVGRCNDKHLLWSTKTGRHLGSMSDDYFNALFLPPYADVARLSASNGSQIVVWNSYSPLRALKSRGPTRREPQSMVIDVEDPFDWGIRLRGTTRQHAWLNTFNSAELELLPPPS